MPPASPMRKRPGPTAGSSETVAARSGGSHQASAAMAPQSAVRTIGIVQREALVPFKDCDSKRRRGFRAVC